MIYTIILLTNIKNVFEVFQNLELLNLNMDLKIVSDMFENIVFIITISKNF